VRVFTFLQTGVLPILFQIFSKFREISQICEYGERKNLQVNTLRVFTWVFTWVNTQVNVGINRIGVTRRHRSRDHSIPHKPFPVDGL